MPFYHKCTMSSLVDENSEEQLSIEEKISKNLNKLSTIYFQNVFTLSELKRRLKAEEQARKQTIVQEQTLSANDEVTSRHENNDQELNPNIMADLQFYYDQTKFAIINIRINRGDIIGTYGKPSNTN
ncbi:unnamed protein product [Rotaria sordida]|uniref:Uncharacterized protein n=1 Tax=Rotaria sordida TaxID=392033 RepID=A0A814QFK3_9BILA|nr:unnamed protein product [Rotaria sordida]CAF1119371.1 unnamed protein product [Rotaria sordida]